MLCIDVAASGSTTPPPWKSPSRRYVAIGVDLPSRDIDDGGAYLMAPASVAESAASTPLVALRRWDLGDA
jgi:hypothetical protein